MRVSASDYGNPPAVTPEDIDGDTIVLTVERVDTYQGGSFQRNRRGQLAVSFAEIADKVLYLNRTMLTILTNKLGNETDRWVGQKIPLEVISVRNPETRENVMRLYPVNEAQWEAVLTESAEVAAEKVAQSAAPAPRRRKRST